MPVPARGRFLSVSPFPKAINCADFTQMPMAPDDVGTCRVIIVSGFSLDRPDLRNNARDRLWQLVVLCCLGLPSED
jgi:hypothetical protein